MELTARQLAVKAIHGDKANVRNPSIMAKYMTQHTNSKLRKIIKELELAKGTMHKNFHIDWRMALTEVITHIKKEITKT